MIWEGVIKGSRWLVGIGLLGLAWHWGTKEQDPIDWKRLLQAALTFFGGVAVMWRPIFYLATRPLMALVDGIFLPGGRLEKPLLNLKLPAHYLEEARYDEALAEYQQILKHYPDETEAYERSIWLEAAVFKRPGKARAVLKKAKRRRLILDPLMVSLAEARERQ